MDKLEVHYNRGYTAMSNHHLRDTSISWQAMGVLSFMLSCREDFKFSIEGLTKCSSCGETATRSALKELREHGYIKISRLIGEGGKVVGWKYDVFENPDVENPDVECQGQSNTNKRITDVKTPNTLFPLSDDKVNKDISPTLELYRFDEFWDAYDKKCGRDRAERAWKKLSKAEVDAAIAYIPSYKAAQPNKMYRKNPEAYINQRAWNDELIGGNDGIPPRPAKGNWVWSEESKKWIPVV